MRFRTTVELGGKTATGMRVPPEIVAGLGAGKKPAVRVTIRDHTYRTTVSPRGGQFLIPVSTDNREGAGVAAGDDVDVDIELDTEPREVAIPLDFADAVAEDADAKGFFDRLSYSQRQCSCWGSRTPRPPRPGSVASSRRSTGCGRAAPSAEPWSARPMSRAVEESDRRLSHIRT